MPNGMLLRSERFASSLWDPRRKYTFKNFSLEKKIPYQPFGNPLSLTLFLEYADWFKEHAVGETHDLRVTQIESTPSGFSLQFADGSLLQSRRVVLATGHLPFRSLPAALAGLDEKLCRHSAQIKDVQAYAGRDVTIIGAGQSALESAALLHEAGAKVRLLVRRSQVTWNPPSSKNDRSLLTRIRKPEAGLGGGWKILAISELPRVFRWLFAAEKRHRFVEQSWGPSGARWLRDRVEGKLELLTQHEIESATPENGGILLRVKTPTGTREMRTDHLIAATGFRTDVERLGYLAPALQAKIAREGRAGKAPALSSSFETSVPGLFIVGMASAPTFGPVMRFMFGGKHAAPLVAQRLRQGKR